MEIKRITEDDRVDEFLILFIEFKDIIYIST